MRIFKNRGSIYIPKSTFQRDKEQKVLLISLVAIVVITLVFVLIFGIKYNFSLKEFVNPFDTSTSTENDGQSILPDVSGKTNYLLIETGKDGTNVRFVILLQVDMDTYAYKTTTISGNTKIDGEKISKIYSLGGGANVETAMGELIGTTFNNYIAVNDGEFADLLNDITSIHYSLGSTIKCSTDGSDSFSLRIKAGEQNLNGEKTLKLMRYYTEVQKDYNNQNDFVINCVQQLISVETIANADNIFKTIVNSTETDITVKDYTAQEDALTVLGDSRTAMSVYSVIPTVEKNVITEDSIKEIKGYFTK